MTLKIAPGFANPDAAYHLLVQAHDGLSADASSRLNARLVLILANHIGDVSVLQEAIALAKQADAQGQEQPV